MRQYFPAIAMTCLLAVPFALSAQERERDRPAPSGQQQGRQYQDKAHHDTHEWNATEGQMYSRYLQEHHKKPHDFEHASKREQADYWKWRHEHSDEHH